ncbi:hypothetical protein Q5H91_14295 [Sphingomonas sp. KR1UV-12]|uniref:PepSY domain-containing protein n=1 Tax=Sphingomonas aurea TaxID=3063994 RepID=A0ABT9EN59_9SPHN|nr:hypothetical protein [Sphingomonas sp. KR1UV-12]MDP1028391.1 hypothetical protein [Sphingomonas sp. KR1UV-12]
MKSPALLTLLLIGLSPTGPGAAAAQKRPDQMQAFDGRRNGRLVPLREIERRVVPAMGGAEYLGSDFDGASGIYTLKFLRNGNVIWVDVDGRSGQIVGRTGN